MPNINDYHEKCCLTCGEHLHGRADKKFCGDYCRATFNNKLVSPTDRAKRIKLIKAAPVLLEALSFCKSVIEKQGMFDLSERMAFDKADAAIKQAS